MEQFTLETIRNVSLLSHSGAGKTTLSEAILFDSKAIARLGRVDEGTTTSDYDPDEIQRKISLNLSVLPYVWQGVKVNLLDTPGYFDFVGEVKSGLRVSEGAIILIGATSGIEVGTEQTWQFCEEANVPRLIFVSKMDRENADFNKVVADIQTKFGTKCVALQIPIGSYTSLKGVVDLLKMKAYIGAESQESEIPADIKSQADSFRAKLVESVASADDKLIEKYIADEAISQEAERQEYEKQIAVLSAQQDERSRISADMHDELGSGVTAIRLLSEIAMQKTKEKPVEEISKISYNANELMTKMNAIIWSMNPGNDSVNSLVAYIRSYASEYLENFKIQYHIVVPVEIPEKDVSGVKRRNIFLVLKESLNNVMKHANASEVTVTIHFNHHMLLEISDNGKGINKEKLNQFGNGLKNMQRRMESIGGSFEISSGNGTTIKLEIPI